MNPRAFYIHAPFCSRRCSYCDFAVEVSPSPPVGDWVTAIKREVDLTGAEQGWEKLTLESLYVGGGTPSLLGVGALRDLLDELRGTVDLDPEVEFTCEANPESFTSEIAADWRATGVNRVSLGAQTFHGDALRWMGRLHGPEGPARAVERARGAGFENVSIDLIFGLPGRLGRDWKADLERTIALDPDHISLYGLTAEAATPLGAWVRDGRESLADEDRYADEYLLAHDLLSAAGYEHYEVSNFARPGRRSVHNMTYWLGDPYAAAGPGAHAYFPPERRWNTRAWSTYRDTLAAGRLPIDGRETVSPEALDLERIWLGLRTDRGYALSPAPEEQRLVESWCASGLSELHGEVVRLLPAGWLLLDRLAVDLQRTRPAAATMESSPEVDGGRAPVKISADSNPPYR